MGRPKKEKVVLHCLLCNGPLTREPYFINLERILGINRFKVKYRPQMHLCQECRDSLSHYITLWYNERNKTDYYELYPKISSSAIDKDDAECYTKDKIKKATPKKEK